MLLVLIHINVEKMVFFLEKQVKIAISTFQQLEMELVSNV